METNQTIGVRLFATEEIGGKRFDGYIKDLWSCLMDGNNLFTIGIHGTAGVGKTEVAKYINNKLLQCPNNFAHVFWVSMSPDWSSWNPDTGSPLYRLRDLQTCVSKAVGVHLSDGDDESTRAAQLAKGLAEKKRSVLILDDVWDYIPLEEVGIPVGVVGGCTVLFTTRSLEVCRQLGCQKKIEIRRLSLDESYELFKKKLGKLPKEVEEISRLVEDKCVGLPLAITIMARNMKGITQKCKWRNAVRGQMRKKADMEIFRKLKTSYDYLNDTTLQHCFLLCASLLEQAQTTDRLAEYLIDGGIINNINSRREVVDEALTMLDILRDAGLLESCRYDFVSMNGLLRSMALQIMEESQPRVMVKNGMSVKDLPNEESWTDELVRVTLDLTKIENIPCNYSPSCSNLSTLVLSRNCKLRHIGDSFFEGMPRLKVLDLSGIGIESLPASVCGLVNLTTLVLSKCYWLKNIPSLAKLKELKKLDLTMCCGVKKLPEDIGALSKLTYLDLSQTSLKEIDSEILAKLTHLQFLRVNWLYTTVKGEAIARLGRLEMLACCFDNIVELNNYLTHLKGGFQQREPPIQLYVQVGLRRICYIDESLYTHADNPTPEGDSGLGLDKCDLNETIEAVNYFDVIAISNCYGARSLCNFSPIKGPTELKHFSIRKCDELEFLCSLSVTGEAVLENIEYMELTGLEKLTVLVRKEGDVVAYGSSCFSNLSSLLIQSCPSIKRLFPTDLVPNLKNLQHLYVFECPLMEEIFEEEEESKIGENKICCLPKLSNLSLMNLPKLKRFCGGETIWHVSKRFSITEEECPAFVNDGVVVDDI